MRIFFLLSTLLVFISVVACNKKNSITPVASDVSDSHAATVANGNAGEPAPPPVNEDLSSSATNPPSVPPPAEKPLAIRPVLSHAQMLAATTGRHRVLRIRHTRGRKHRAHRRGHHRHGKKSHHKKKRHY